MSKRKSFVLRIDPDTFRLIERWADDEFRSVNGQMEWIIRKSLKEAGRWKPRQKKLDDENRDKKKT